MSMGAAFLGMQGAGALFKGISGYQAGTYASEIADYNAEVARVRAEDIKRIATIEYNQEKAVNQRIVGAQKAAYGASGVAMEGSPMNVMLNSALKGEYNALLRKYSTLSEASALESQAGIFEEQALLARQRRLGSILTSGLELGTDIFGYYAQK